MPDVVVVVVVILLLVDVVQKVAEVGAHQHVVQPDEVVHFLLVGARWGTPVLFLPAVSLSHETPLDARARRGTGPGHTSRMRAGDGLTRARLRGLGGARREGRRVVGERGTRCREGSRKEEAGEESPVADFKFGTREREGGLATAVVREPGLALLSRFVVEWRLIHKKKVKGRGGEEVL